MVNDIDINEFDKSKTLPVSNDGYLPIQTRNLDKKYSLKKQKTTNFHGYDLSNSPDHRRKSNTNKKS